MNTVLITVACIILVSVIGMLIDVSLRFDVGENQGRLVVKLFKIPFCNLDIKVEGDILNFTKLKKRTKSFGFQLNKKNLSFIKALRKNFAHRLYLSRVDIDCFVILSNPASACLISSAIMSFIAFVKHKIIKFQPDAKIDANVLTGFGDNQVVLLLDLQIAISIIDFVWACAKTLFERRNKYGKRYRKFNH